MTLDTTKSADFEWQTALQAELEAEQAFERFKTMTVDPLLQREEAFLRGHGLIAPKIGRNGTPGYFERRWQLRAENPGAFVPDYISDASELLCNAYSDAQAAVMNVPAPNLAALRWKLDYILSPDEGTIASWSIEYVQQMLADIERLLPPGGA